MTRQSRAWVTDESSGREREREREQERGRRLKGKGFCMYKPLMFWRMMDEKVKKVPRRLVGWGSPVGCLPAGVVGEDGTVVHVHRA